MAGLRVPRARLAAVSSARILPLWSPMTFDRLVDDLRSLSPDKKLGDISTRTCSGSRAPSRNQRETKSRRSGGASPRCLPHPASESDAIHARLLRGRAIRTARRSRRKLDWRILTIVSVGVDGGLRRGEILLPCDNSMSLWRPNRWRRRNRQVLYEANSNELNERDYLSETSRGARPPSPTACRSRCSISTSRS